MTFIDKLIKYIKQFFAIEPVKEEKKSPKPKAKPKKKTKKAK